MAAWSLTVMTSTHRTRFRIEDEQLKSRYQYTLVSRHVDVRGTCGTEVLCILDDVVVMHDVQLNQTTQMEPCVLYDMTGRLD